MTILAICIHILRGTAILGGLVFFYLGYMVQYPERKAHVNRLVQSLVARLWANANEAQKSAEKLTALAIVTAARTTNALMDRFLVGGAVDFAVASLLLSFSSALLVFGLGLLLFNGTVNGTALELVGGGVVLVIVARLTQTRAGLSAPSRILKVLALLALVLFLATCNANSEHGGTNWGFAMAGAVFCDALAVRIFRRALRRVRPSSLWSTVSLFGVSTAVATVLVFLPGVALLVPGDISGSEPMLPALFRGDGTVVAGVMWVGAFNGWTILIPTTFAFAGAAMLVAGYFLPALVEAGYRSDYKAIDVFKDRAPLKRAAKWLLSIGLGLTAIPKVSELASTSWRFIQEWLKK